MKALSELIQAPVHKILIYFGFAISKRTSRYNIYSHQERINKFYIFRLPDQDLLSVFSTEKFLIIQKDELLFELNSYKSMAETSPILNGIMSQGETEFHSNITESTTTKELINYIISLRDPIDQPGQWYTTPLFTKRVFGNSTSGYKIPLCIFKDRKFVQFVGTLEWEGRTRAYLNNRTDGFFTSNFLPGATKLLVTSDPLAWEYLGQTATAQEYLFFIAHHDSTLAIYKTIDSLFEQYSFAKISLCLASNEIEDLRFTLNYVAHFINSQKGPFLIYFNSYSNAVEATFFVQQETLQDFTVLISELNSAFENFLIGDQRSDISLNPGVLKGGSMATTKVIFSTHAIYSMRFINTPNQIHTFLKTLISFANCQDRFEFIIKY